jgi:hypothetical protein
MASDLPTLRLGARRRADMESDPLVDDTELNRYVNDGVRELYAIVATAFEDTYLTSSQFVVTAPNFTQALPAGFWKARGLDRLEGSRWVPCRTFTFRERNRDDGRPRWRVDSSIRLSPEDRAAGSYRFWFYPTAPQLASDVATLDSVLDEWVRFIEIHAAIQCLTKAQLDTTQLKTELVELKAEIRDAVPNRQGEPEQAPTEEDDPYARVWS